MFSRSLLKSVPKLIQAVNPAVKLNNVVRNISISSSFFTPRVQEPAPNFSGIAVISSDFKNISLSDYKGKYVVLVFYPLDFTFVCPTELIALNDKIEDFKKLGAEVIGCSVDSHFTHLGWMNTDKAKGGLGQLRYPLLSDLNKTIARDYGVLLEKDGIALRGMFIIDPNGILRQITINDLPIGRSVDEALRIIEALKFVEEHGEVCPANWRKGDKTIKPDPKANPKYYVVYPEKENLMAVAQSNAIKTHQSVNKIVKSMKPNSRSVLRSSVAKNQEKQIVAQVKSAVSDCDIYLKRFSKNKDALLAKRFHNFLNRTTIPQAPVRQKRQPRKQEIKPIVERSSEEIIVQEVLVSSNGFVESFDRDCDVKPLRVTAIVELSDSDDEKTSKSFKIRVNQKRKFDQSVIEIHSDEESVSNPNQTKGTSHLNPKKLDHPPPRAKRKKVQSKVKATGEFVLKKEVICPYCPKTFPSQNSLNTHIIHHNLENSLKNKTKMSLNTRQSMFAKPECKHKCEECQATFRNKILLEKHQCTSKQNSLTCSVCLKQFRDMTLLNIHKKSHAKANLMKNTTLIKVSPRKSVLKVPSSPKNSLIGGFKCSECPKVCDSESKLSAHVKIHKKFVCTFCSGTFASKVMLDSHMRSNCVKNKRISYTVKKSFVHTPTKRLSIASEGDLNQSTLGVKMNCDKCSMKFGTFRSLYTHKVQKHGMSTPDKTLLNKPKGGVCDARSAHGGVPANPRLQQAFAVMRKKLAEAGNLTIK